MFPNILDLRMVREMAHWTLVKARSDKNLIFAVRISPEDTNCPQLASKERRRKLTNYRHIRGLRAIHFHAKH